MDDLEKIYDEEISPLMDKIIAICDKHKMPMFAEFQFSADGFCRTGRGQDSYHHPVLDHYAALSQCKQGTGLNIDKYLLWLMRQARDTGHQSMVLRALDIPTEPMNNG
ncbi:MAG: hypothetical protein OEY52_17075 [Gammaproteobacteria bacterium]|nr:hypothetical protein [Gammaproteobacteria bacterium]